MLHPTQDGRHLMLINAGILASAPTLEIGTKKKKKNQMAIAFFCTKKPKTNPKLKNEMILKVLN
jgi:hypothetical protein